MAIFGNMSKATIALDHPIDDHITKMQEAIEELRQDVSILRAEIMRTQMSSEDGLVSTTDDPTVDRTIWQNDKVMAALKILSAIPFTHDLDDQEMHECAKVADRIYRAKVSREKNLECLGRLPAQRQILAWIIVNYRKMHPVTIDIHRFIDGLFRIADYVPTDINWNVGETNALSFRWMNGALVVPVPDHEFSF